MCSLSIAMENWFPLICKWETLWSSCQINHIWHLRDKGTKFPLKTNGTKLMSISAKKNSPEILMNWDIFKIQRALSNGGQTIPFIDFHTAGFKLSLNCLSVDKKEIVWNQLFFYCTIIEQYIEVIIRRGALPLDYRYGRKSPAKSFDRVSSHYLGIFIVCIEICIEPPVLRKMHWASCI